MNIPEIVNETKQGLRAVSTVQPQGVVKPSSEEASTKAPGNTVENKKSQSISKEDLNALIQDTEKRLESKGVNLKFNVLEENDTVQVEIIDAKGKTIRKIPDDSLVKLSESLKNLDRGFIDKIS